MVNFINRDFFQERSFLAFNYDAMSKQHHQCFNWSSLTGSSDAIFVPVAGTHRREHGLIEWAGLTPQHCQVLAK